MPQRSHFCVQAAVMYHSWLERNARIFPNTAKDHMSLLLGSWWSVKEHPFQLVLRRSWNVPNDDPNKRE